MNGITVRESALEESDIIPFSPIKLMQDSHSNLRIKKDSNVFEDSRSDIMNEKLNSRSHSMVPIR